MQDNFGTQTVVRSLFFSIQECINAVQSAGYTENHQPPAGNVHKEPKAASCIVVMVEFILYRWFVTSLV